jgi:hypothetical protein
LIKFFNSIIKKIKKKIVDVFLGKEYCDSLQKIENYNSQIDLMSSLVGEQSRLIVSIALIQNDMAKSMYRSDSLEIDEKCLVVKIPFSDDEFLN